MDIIKLLKDKLDHGVLTLEEVKILCPEYEDKRELVILLDNPYVQEYIKLLGTVQEYEVIPDVQEYIRLTSKKGGTKSPMPCLACGQSSHHVKWSTVKVDGVDHWVGDVSHSCTGVERLRFKRGLTIAEMVNLKLPLSEGQIAGRYKKDGEDGLHHSSGK